MKTFSRRSSRRLVDGLCGKKRGPEKARTRRSWFNNLEILDERLAPAVFNVNSTADILTPPSGVVTLRSAIEQANATPGGNTINLTVPGLYQITIPQNGNFNNSGGAFTIMPGSGNLTIQNTSGGAVAVSANGLDRVFDINPNDSTTTAPFTVTLIGFTVENGVVSPGDTGTGTGGGIRDQGNASLTLTNMVLTHNTASADGGGLSMENLVSAPWLLTITNSIISDNHAGDAGGGVEEDGSGKVVINPGTQIIDNTCVNQGAGIWLDAVTNGNGVTQSANLTIDGAVINDNQGLTVNCFGGGIGNAGNGAVSITDTTVDHNFSGGVGGGFADEGNFGTLTVLNSIFDGNSTAGNGGGIQEGGPTTTLTNVEINNNSSGDMGGGIFASGTTLTMTNCSVIDNIAAGNGMGTNGGGGIELQTTGTGNTGSTITNSTISFNKADNNADAQGGGIDASTLAGSVVVSGDTIEHNFATSGGGIFYGGMAGSSFSVGNSVVAENVANTGPDADNPAGTFTDLGGNLIGVSGAGGGNTGFTASTTRTGTVANPLVPPLTLTTGDLSAVSSNGTSTVFSISPAGFIYETVGNGTPVKLGDGGKQLSASTDTSGTPVVFVVTTTGELAKYSSSTGWQVIGATGTIAQVSAGHDSGGNADAFVITTGGTIVEFRDSSGWTSVPTIPNNETPVQLSAVDQDRLVVLNSDHSIWEHDPQTGWYPLTSPGFAESVSASTNTQDQVVTFAQTLNGALYMHTNTMGWAAIGGPGSIAQISAGKDASGNAVVFVISTSNDVLQFDTAKGWSLVSFTDSPVTEISATTSDAVFATFADGSVEGFNPSTGVFNVGGPGFAMP